MDDYIELKEFNNLEDAILYAVKRSNDLKVPMIYSNNPKVTIDVYFN